VSFVARDAGSSGTVTLADQSSLWDVGAPLYIGGSDVSQGGTGEVMLSRVAPGAEIHVQNTLKIWPTGTLKSCFPGDIVFPTGGHAINAGSIQIGCSPASSLTIHGNYEQEPSGTLEIDIEDVVGIQSDQLIVGGDAMLNGTLTLKATCGPEVSPVWGDAAHTIIMAPNIIGTFAQEPAAGEHLGHGVFLLGVWYTNTTVDVGLFQAAAGDVDGNREINNSDLQQILGANSFNHPGDWGWPQGDFNCDGLVNNTDLQLILATGLFGTGPYAASADGMPDGSPISVPEPGTLLMLACGLIGLWWRRRRRAT